MLDERWVFHENAEPVQAGPGVVRRVLAYSKDLMCVENTFEEGAVGSLHHHPHTQITYVVSGEFEFNQKEGLIPRSLLRNKLFQDMEEVIY